MSRLVAALLVADRAGAAESRHHQRHRLPEGDGAEHLDADQRHRSSPQLRERAAAAKVPKTAPPPGRNQFRLIGVSEFNLPAAPGPTVIIKGLLIKATPVSRLNITSVTRSPVVPVEPQAP